MAQPEKLILNLRGRRWLSGLRRKYAFAACHADGREHAQHLGRLPELDEVELHVLARGEVAPAARIGLGDVGEHLELVGLDLAVRDLHPHHLAGAALALAVDALVEAEDAELVVVELTREVPAHAVLEAVELVGDDGVEGGSPEFGDVDHRSTSEHSQRGRKGSGARVGTPDGGAGSRRRGRV